jgi:membrane-associated protease RseP (regulator of RpoE activity)
LTVASVWATGGPEEGPALVAGLLSILLAHEMGHYLACRYYGVDATLPLFLPAPILSFVGTFGAFIRIRSPFPNRCALFDIGIAGPLAGFAVALPVLYLGVLEARVVPPPPDTATLISFADPLLFQWVFAWARGDVPEGMTVLIGPLGLAAWFGLFVTALNLIPIGQLDGGHVSYALFGRHAHALSRWMWWVCVALIYFSPSWILWAVLVRLLGRRHPPTLNDLAPLGRARVAVAVLGAAVFAVCFVPNPILDSWRPLLEALGALGR